jgi:hypothetical protein
MVTKKTKVKKKNVGPKEALKPRHKTMKGEPIKHNLGVLGVMTDQDLLSPVWRTNVRIIYSCYKDVYEHMLKRQLKKRLIFPTVGKVVDSVNSVRSYQKKIRTVESDYCKYKAIIKKLDEKEWKKQQNKK